MDNDVDRATELLFPDSGRHAVDVKFFFQSGATARALARQIIVCFGVMADETCTIVNVDTGLTAT